MLFFASGYLEVWSRLFPIPARGVPPIIHMTLKMADSTCEQHPGGRTHHRLHFLLLAKVFVIMGLGLAMELLAPWPPKSRNLSVSGSFLLLCF